MTRIELYARGGLAIEGGEGVDPRRPYVQAGLVCLTGDTLRLWSQ